MCGRYVASSSTDALVDWFDADVDERSVEAPVSYNVAPTDPVPVVANSSDGRRLVGTMRWGLVPSWSKDTKGAARMINARSETVGSAPAFRKAFTGRRCIVPADGFYEWEHGPGRTKLPWFISRADGAPLAMAGLWAVWRPPGTDGPWVRTCSVLTVPANKMMEPLHDRMPVILDADDWAEWLDRSVTRELTDLLVPVEDEVLVRRRVSTRVNSVQNNDPALLDEGVTDGDAPPVPLTLL